MIAVEVRDLHKVFRIPHERHTTLTERFLSLFRPVSFESFEALKGVSLSIEAGSFVGLIGGNGSGKSTLLKVMSGLIIPDRGEVRVNGSMSALLELGLGFSPELTVRENVELYAAVLGYPRSELGSRVDQAIHFADLDRFRDAKLKNLSTGMKARLGFATALQADSDIMLLDEILAVGDASFQMKCLDVFEDFKRRRKTIVLVSHNLAQIERFCDRAAWMNHGQIVADGQPYRVISEYLGSVGQLDGPAEGDDQKRLGDGQIRIFHGWIEDEEGRRTESLRSGQNATAIVHFQINEKTVEPVFGLTVVGENAAAIYSINSNWSGLSTGTVNAGQVVEMRVPFFAALRDGRYNLQVGALSSDMSSFYDFALCATSFVVRGSNCRIGVADLQGEATYRILPDPGDALEADGAQQRGGKR